MTQTIEIGQNASGQIIDLKLDKANRHGLVTGATGTGKTVTLQLLAEGFSRAGVPVFAADVKGDLSGIAATGDADGKAAARSLKMGRAFAPERFPSTLYDLAGVKGHPIKTSVQNIGADLMAQMLRLNETQAGALSICWKKAIDESAWMMTLDDLRWSLNAMIEDRETVCQEYGNVTASSINTAQRQLLALEAQGGADLFGEPGFDILSLMATDADGRGMINLLHADDLMEAPKLYSTFLLWLLTELFRKLPEAGDLDKPKLVFFFDEAHLLFRDTPPILMEKIERLVRLVRSKGVGVYFVTQSPSDVPDVILAQLGNRIQHALRAYTPKDQKMIAAAAKAFRPNKGVDVKTIITEMGVGEALVSCLDEYGVPAPVERVTVFSPSAHIGPISDLEREAIIQGSAIQTRYGDLREQAYYFQRRMMTEAGKDPGPDNGVPEYDGNLWQQHMPDFQLEPLNQGPSRLGFAVRAVAWGVLSIICFTTAIGFLA